MVKTRAPDETPENQEESNDDAGLEACGQNLCHALERKDYIGAAKAVKAIFAIADAEPHVEGEHVEPHSYDAQNQKAAE